MKPIEKSMINIINKERVTRGLKELIPSEHLTHIASFTSKNQKNRLITHLFINN